MSAIPRRFDGACDRSMLRLFMRDKDFPGKAGAIQNLCETCAIDSILFHMLE